MADAGGSARREYERRAAKDQARIDSNRAQRMALVVMAPVLVFCAVRFGVPWAWDGFISSMTSRAEVDPTPSPLDGDLLNLGAAVVALGATLSVWQQMFGRRQTTEAWRQGAEGEQLTARILSRLPDGYVVLHDVPMPRSRGNIDHIVIGPTGAFTVETKAYKGGIRISRGQVTASGRRRDRIPDQARRQAGAAAGYLGLEVSPIVVVHGGVELGWFSSPTVEGVRFCGSRRLRKLLTDRAVVLTDEDVATAAERIGGTAASVTSPPSEQSSEPTSPPRRSHEAPAGDRCTCGGEWIVRHRRSDGAPFLGCSRFPKCRRTSTMVPT